MAKSLCIVHIHDRDIFLLTSIHVISTTLVVHIEQLASVCVQTITFELDNLLL